ncbi:MAG TPA: M1 family aminopeptidase, partial [Thermoanaerobaculia bacterium]|nr:M1 family aminopeptidase [Thermoanaerobaculia bacterium]
ILVVLLGGELAISGCIAAPAADIPTRGSFAPLDQPAQYPSDRLYHLQHLRLELDFDLRRRTVAGTATNTVVPLLPGLDHLVFHAAGLQVSRVRLGADQAKELEFSTDPEAQTLSVRLPRAYGPQDRLEVAIDYSAQPRAGLYVAAPDRAYPERPWQMFSDGEPQLNRYWFPSWDEPDDRATSELLATVARPFEAIGNGRLVAVTDRPDGRRTFHWLMEQPHSTYLVSVVIGEFSRLHDSWQGVPIDSYVPRALAERAARAFGRTADAIDFLSRATGRPYPYAKYSQAAVYGFMWEGMENISASTETVDTLRDARAALDGTSDDLVVHELAHQWFGDLVTCRSWAHAWLNEGMATYFEALYQQHLARQGGAAGDDELAWKLDQSRVNYLREDRERYRRPLVTSRYVSPIRMFDAHTYDKGAWVLHMLHELVGEEGWWRGVRTYLARHAFGTVTSRDLEAAFEDAAGVDLGALFDQFVYRAGYPEIKLRWDFQAATGLVRLEVRQTQPLDGATGLFSFPVEVALLDGRGTRSLRRVAMAAVPLQDLYLPCPVRPRTVVFDPGGALLKSLDFDKPATEWVEQLRAPLPLPAQLDALRALAELGGDEAVAALGETLLHHRFFGARLVAAAALARIDTEPALQALRQGAGDADARVRAVVLTGFGAFPEQRELIAPLVRALEGDASYQARAAAAASLGQFQDRRQEVTPPLLRALGQSSFLEAVPRAAIKALAELGAPEALPQALRLARYGSPQPGRADAMLALAIYAGHGGHGGDDVRRRTVRRALEDYLDDPDFEVRLKVPEALAELGDPGAIPALRRSLRAEVQDEQRRPREDALRELQQQTAANPPSSQALDERLRQLQRTNEVLEEQLHELQEDRAAGPAVGSTPASGSAPPAASALASGSAPASGSGLAAAAPTDRPEQAPVHIQIPPGRSSAAVEVAFPDDSRSGGRANSPGAPGQVHRPLPAAAPAPTTAERRFVLAARAGQTLRIDLRASVESPGLTLAVRCPGDGHTGIGRHGNLQGSAALPESSDYTILIRKTCAAPVPPAMLQVELAGSPNRIAARPYTGTYFRQDGSRASIDVREMLGPPTGGAPVPAAPEAFAGGTGRTASQAAPAAASGTGAAAAGGDTGPRLAFSIAASEGALVPPGSPGPGTAHGTVTLRDGVGVYEKGGCRLTFRFGRPGTGELHVDQAGDCGFGDAVAGRGDYRRTSLCAAPEDAP